MSYTGNERKTHKSGFGDVYRVEQQEITGLRYANMLKFVEREETSMKNMHSSANYFTSKGLNRIAALHFMWPPHTESSNK